MDLLVGPTHQANFPGLRIGINSVKRRISRVWNYRLGWLLLTTSLGCGITAAVYFEKSDHEFIIAAFRQAAAVFLALTLAYFFFESRAQTRQRRIDETVKSSVDLLRNLATSAVITATGQWWDKPEGHDSYGLTNGPKLYQEARDLVIFRSHQLEDYPNNRHSLGSLDWVFRRFEHVVLYSRQMIQTVQPGLVEYGALIRAMVDLEKNILSEKQVWEEFQLRVESRQVPMPSEAGYNLFSIAELTVRLIDVLDSKELKGDPEYEAGRKLVPETFWRSRDWGNWR